MNANRLEKLDALYEERLQRIIQTRQCSKQEARTLLVMLRFKIREGMADYNKERENCRYFKRQREILKRQGYKAPFLDRKIELHRTYADGREKIVALQGNSLQVLLGVWEEAGATLDDLYDLCGIRKLNADKQKAIDEHTEDSLFETIFVYNLDYPNDGKGFIEGAMDAPFTHAAKAFMLDVMLNTPEGQEASHDAMMAVFPEIMEHAMTVRENEFGEKCLYDHEGNLVGTLTEGE